MGDIIFKRFLFKHFLYKSNYPSRNNTIGNTQFFQLIKISYSIKIYIIDGSNKSLYAHINSLPIH